MNSRSFDMDGVLADTEPVHVRAWQAVLDPRGVALNTAWFLPWVGIPDETLAAHLCEDYPLTETAEILLDVKRETFHAMVEADVRPFPGVEAGIDALRDATGLPMGVVTSTSRCAAERMLAAWDLARRLPLLVAGDDPVTHKPDPAPYATGASKLGAPPSRCVALEDSPAGVASAHAAGCTVLAVTSSYGADILHEADMAFPTTADAITEALRRCGVSPIP